MVDPRYRSDEVPIFWQPESLPSTVVLVPSKASAGRNILRFAPAAGPGVLATRQATDGVDAILTAEGGEHRLWLPEPLSDGAPMAALIVLDDDTPRRVDAVLRLWRHLRRKPGNARQKLTVQQRQRLILSLRALDGHLAGASYRTIATVLFGHARLAGEPWEASSIRDRTIRLVRGGVRLMRHGYHALLRGRLRR